MRLSALLAAASRTLDNDGNRVNFRLYRGVLHDCAVGSLDHDTRTIPARVRDGSSNENGNATSAQAKSGAQADNQRSIFFALRGTQTDGERFIDDAIAAGAAAIVCVRRRACRRAAAASGVTVIRCRRPQLLMSAMAHLLYGTPSELMQIVGVTGTDGKSTTAYFIYQLLRLLGIRCGIVSTVMIDDGKSSSRDDGATVRLNSAHLTTPSAPQLHRALATMRLASYTHAIIETSSHALTPETARVAHVRYNGALITNITSEHLEFHRTQRRYWAAKARLLCMLQSAPLPAPPPFVLSAATVVVQRYLQRQRQRCAPARHRAAKAAETTAHAAPPQLISYRIDRGDLADGTPPHRQQLSARAYAELVADRLRGAIADHSADGISLQIAVPNDAHNGSAATDGVPLPATITVRLPFCGAYNAENTLGALYATQLLSGRPLAEVAPFAEQLALPPGRLMRVSDPQRHRYRVFVDYAHTAASLREVLQLFRPLTAGRLVALFGSAGLRDREKRSKMGTVAAEYADIIYLTSEDPRDESPQAIADEIMRGITVAARQPQTHIVLNREQAIGAAIEALQPDDTLLLLGKGHEQSIITADGEALWDEGSVARRYLAG